jgi:hypothetical protein
MKLSFILSLFWIIPLGILYFYWLLLGVIIASIGRLLFCSGIFMLDGRGGLKDAWELTS